MAARRSVWPDAEVQELASRFLPVADEVGRLQRGNEAECVLFRKVAEQGHYRGRTQPTNTRQGIYALAPSGAFLASCNTQDPRRVAKTLSAALAKWQQLTDAQRYDAKELAAVAHSFRLEDRCPTDGLVLRVTSRDLPRAAAAQERAGWMQDAWNRDYAWFTAEEARSLVPAEPVPQQRHDWPAPLALRVARHHLVDNVRGQTSSHKAGWVQRAAIHATVVRLDGDVVELALGGDVAIEGRGHWSVGSFADMDRPSPQTLGMRVRLAGTARFDRRAGRFVAFELIAAGERHGGTLFNYRADDLAPNPIGFCFELAAPHERTAPAAIWAYEKPGFTNR